MTHRRRARGFTLVEVLVALTIMAILAGLAWQGIDGMLRARDGTRRALEATVKLSTIITQWEQDLNALYDDDNTAIAPPLSFDGQSLRLVRRTEGGVRMVTWSLRSGVWLRWTGPVVTRVAELQDSWMRSQQLLGTEPDQLRLLDGVTDLQIHYYRGNAWTNAQSTGSISTAPPGTPGAAPRDTVPDGVRLLLTIGDRTLTRDIALGPG